MLIAATATLAGCSLFLDGNSPPACDAPSDELLGHWRLDGLAALGDERGGPAARAEGSLEEVTGRCNSGLRFAPADTGHLVIEAGDIRARIRAIDLFVRVPVADISTAGVLAADAEKNGAGHLSLWVAESSDEEPLFVARLQDGAGGDAFRCGVRPPDGEWVHIGINVGLGGFEMSVDGSPAELEGTAAVESLSGLSPCTRSQAPLFETTLADNSNPWVLGASSGSSTEDTTDDLRSRFAGGAVDNLRLWSERQAF